MMLIIIYKDRTSMHAACRECPDWMRRVQWDRMDFLCLAAAGKLLHTR